MEAKPSLARRAVCAVALMIGFYLIACAILAGLFFLLYAEFRYSRRLHLRVVIFCGIGIFSILRAILPRWDKFAPPGPLLRADTHRRLFKELEDVAARVNQPMPQEVYLLPNANAWVAHRGGVMGWGSRPVMGIGLPLLQVLSVSELRAVLAHEFGHYHGGDVKLAPWVYKTREAIGRALQYLEGRMLGFPFLWYGKMFLRITNGISRQQEYQADALAAELAGADAMKTGLKKVHEANLAFAAFWETEVVPVLSAGFHPPIAGGFQAFLNEPDIAGKIARKISEEMEEPQASPYDTHPPMRDRLAAIGQVSACRLTPDTRPAFELLENAEALEAEMVGMLFKSPSGAAWQAIRWAEVGERALLPLWTAQAEKYGELLDGIRLGELGAYAVKPETLVERFDREFSDEVTPQQKVQTTQSIVGVAVAVLLHKRGWGLTSDVGKPMMARLGDVAIPPFTLMADMASGQLSQSDWNAICHKTAIAEADLGEVSPPKSDEAECASQSLPSQGESASLPQTPATVWVEAETGRSWTCPCCGEINQPLYDCCYRCGDRVQRRIVSPRN